MIINEYFGFLMLLSLMAFISSFVFEIFAQLKIK
jgi:hypothetical protein